MVVVVTLVWMGGVEVEGGEDGEGFVVTWMQRRCRTENRKISKRPQRERLVCVLFFFCYREGEGVVVVVVVVDVRCESGS